VGADVLLVDLELVPLVFVAVAVRAALSHFLINLSVS
jgi:hypothetical protein